MLAQKRVFFAAIAIFASCTSCQDDSQTEFSSSPEVTLDVDAIIKRGYINALVDNNSISYFVYKGQPMGYEYELLKRLADHLQVDLKIKVTSGVENAITLLNKGEGDILAFPLTINKTRKKYISFTNPHFNTYQVLVQRKPVNWKKLSPNHLDDQLIRTPAQLIGKEVHIIDGTAYDARLSNLSEEIGGDITIRKDSAGTESEALIARVASGQIDYTISDHTIARVNAAYYDNLDINTVLSIPQQIAWGTRQNSPALTATINTWLAKIKKEAVFMVIYNRYFKSPRTSLLRMQSDYSSISGYKLSPYDSIIKDGARRLHWDWLLLASVVYQESKFINHGESWAGARGLMQLMPATARRFGAKNLDDPNQNIRAGVKYLQFLDRYWSRRIPDDDQRLKFVLASYNAGLSHIIDASKLAEKNKRNPMYWEDSVEYFLLKKSESKYYRDPDMLAGYCKCQETVNYVKDVLQRFEEYKTHFSG